MEPRHLAGVAVISRSFARIHETNLKKQGMLPLTFADPADYDTIHADDRISILSLAGSRPDGSSRRSSTTPTAAGPDRLNHSLNAEQVGWFGGSA
jgi:aconitate hydratase